MPKSRSYEKEDTSYSLLVRLEESNTSSARTVVHPWSDHRRSVDRVSSSPSSFFIFSSPPSPSSSASSPPPPSLSPPLVFPSYLYSFVFTFHVSTLLARSSSSLTEQFLTSPLYVHLILFFFIYLHSSTLSSSSASSAPRPVPFYGSDHLILFLWVSRLLLFLL